MTARDQWTRWLQLEDEAVWTYPIIGARVSTLEAAAANELAAHQTTRARLLARFNERGWPVPATPAAYDIATIDGADQARAVAQDIENRITSALAALVGVVDRTTRRQVTTDLTRAAAAAVGWGAEVQPFPGLR